MKSPHIALLLLLGTQTCLMAEGDEIKAFCRFVPERLDDFSWENDRIAFRVYGPKMWTMPDKRCSSGIDVWVKKVRYPIIDKWMKNSLKGGGYHEDRGEGADFYKVEKTLGCGGVGYIVDGKLQLNRHYSEYKVITGEGDWIEFELKYPPLAVGEKTVTETKRYRMELGDNLFQVRNTFRIEGGGSVDAAVGIVRRGGKDQLEHGDNWISYAEPANPKSGQTYCGAVLAKPGKFQELDGHALLVTPVSDGDTLTYWAGAAWNKGLDFKNVEEWNQFIAVRAAALASYSGVEVSLVPGYFPPVDAAAKRGPEVFRDWPAGKSPAEIGLKVSENFLKRGHYQHHKHLRYPGIVTWFGALKVARETGDNLLAERLVRRFDFYLKKENEDRFHDEFHVDFAVHGVLPLELYRLTKDEKLRTLGMKRADEQWKDPTPDGVTRQARYWVDDIYMISAIQTAAYRVTGDARYLDRAALTAATYLSKLQKEDGLFWHAEDSPFVWGRGVGWYAAGMTEILKELPADHPQRKPIMEGYLKMMTALLKHQSESGLWRQLVDKPESWLETSGSGMFAYAIVTGVKRGWLDEATYGPVGRKAWLALIDQLDANGNLSNVCIGTNKGAKVVGAELEKQYEFYMARARITGDYHGQAPLLWTAAALLEK